MWWHKTHAAHYWANVSFADHNRKSGLQIIKFDLMTFEVQSRFRMFDHMSLRCRSKFDGCQGEFQLAGPSDQTWCSINVCIGCYQFSQLKLLRHYRRTRTTDQQIQSSRIAQSRQLFCSPSPIQVNKYIFMIKSAHVFCSLFILHSQIDAWQQVAQASLTLIVLYLFLRRFSFTNIRRFHATFSTLHSCFSVASAAGFFRPIRRMKPNRVLNQRGIFNFRRRSKIGSKLRKPEMKFSG